MRRGEGPLGTSTLRRAKEGENLDRRAFLRRGREPLGTSTLRRAKEGENLDSRPFFEEGEGTPGY